MADVFDAHAAELLADLEGRVGRATAPARALVGSELVAWVDELRAAFDEARAAAPTAEDRAAAAAAPAFEGATVTRPARALAATLGRRVGRLDRAGSGRPRSRTSMPRARGTSRASTPDGWARVVLASAVRAYVPAIDPHGAWAPLDEESSVYEVDLEARPPSRLWDKAERTAVGVKIEAGATPPLADGDVVLSLAGLADGGAELRAERAARVRRVRRAAAGAGRRAARGREAAGHHVARRRAGRGASRGRRRWRDDDDLPVERVEYGDGDAIVVADPRRPRRPGRRADARDAARSASARAGR